MSHDHSLPGQLQGAAATTAALGHAESVEPLYAESLRIVEVPKTAPILRAAQPGSTAAVATVEQDVEWAAVQGALCYGVQVVTPGLFSDGYADVARSASLALPATAHGVPPADAHFTLGTTIRGLTPDTKYAYRVRAGVFRAQQDAASSAGAEAPATAAAAAAEARVEWGPWSTQMPFVSRSLALELGHMQITASVAKDALTALVAIVRQETRRMASATRADLPSSTTTGDDAESAPAAADLHAAVGLLIDGLASARASAAQLAVGSAASDSALRAAEFRSQELECVLAAAQSRTKDVEGSLTAVQSRVQVLEGSLAAAQSRTKELEGSLALTQSRTKELEGSLALTQSRTKELEGSLAAAQSRTKEVEGSSATALQASTEERAAARKAQADLVTSAEAAAATAAAETMRVCKALDDERTAAAHAVMTSAAKSRSDADAAAATAEASTAAAVASAVEALRSEMESRIRNAADAAATTAAAAASVSARADAQAQILSISSTHLAECASLRAAAEAARASARAAADERASALSDTIGQLQQQVEKATTGLAEARRRADFAEAALAASRSTMSDTLAALAAARAEAKAARASAAATAPEAGARAEQPSPASAAAAAAPAPSSDVNAAALVARNAALETALRAARVQEFDLRELVESLRESLRTTEASAAAGAATVPVASVANHALQPPVAYAAQATTAGATGSIGNMVMVTASSTPGHGAAAQREAPRPPPAATAVQVQANVDAAPLTREQLAVAVQLSALGLPYDRCLAAARRFGSGQEQLEAAANWVIAADEHSI